MKTVLLIFFLSFIGFNSNASSKTGYIFVIDGSESMLEKPSPSLPSKAASAVKALNETVDWLKVSSKNPSGDIYAGAFFFITQSVQKDNSRPTTLEPTGMPLRKVNAYTGLPITIRELNQDGVPASIDSQINFYFRGKNTGIGDAISLAAEKAQGFSTIDINWNIIVLTDGKQNAGRTPKEVLLKVKGQLPNLKVHWISYETSDELGNKLKTEKLIASTQYMTINSIQTEMPLMVGQIYLAEKEDDTSLSVPQGAKSAGTGNLMCETVDSWKPATLSESDFEYSGRKHPPVANFFVRPEVIDALEQKNIDFRHQFMRKCRSNLPVYSTDECLEQVCNEIL